MPTVGGFVFDYAGVPVNRKLRFYRRDTGQLLGETMSSGIDDGDPYFDEVALLLHMDGADGSKEFLDSSPLPKTMTVNGNAKNSAVQSKFGGTSMLLGGYNDYLYSPAHADFVFGTGDFTLEMWINTTTVLEKVLVDQYISNETSWQMSVKDGKLTWYSIEGAIGAYSLTGATFVNTGNWRHVAATRSAGTLRFFVDGVLDGAVALSTNYSIGTVLGIGAQVGSRNNSYDFPGYIDDLRITKGVARYTANFTPPTEALPNRATLDRSLAFGEYYFPTTYAGEVQVVCLDDASEPLENDIILRTFPA